MTLPPPSTSVDLPDPAPGPRTPAPPRRRRRSPWIVTTVSVAVIVILGTVIAPWDAERRQAIADQLTVWSNPPATEIVALAEATGMTETARRIFFASRPLVEGAESFNQHCDIEDQTVLGCFDGERIYIYRVTDDRLAGTNEVTAAHEMLHAAYLRLSRADRLEVDRMVSGVVDSLAADHPVGQLLERYPETQHADEWHARLGTEFAELPAGLEAHFGEYFVDRAAIVALHEQSTGQLRELQSQIDALDRELAELSAELDGRAERYQGAVDAYYREVEDFNSRADAGWFTTREQFDAERAVLVDRQARLEKERQALNGEVERHNELLAALRELDASRADLYSSLDSTAAPTTPID